MKTFMQTKETVDRKWYVIDAAGKPLGRVASKAAHILRGKNKPTFTPHIDCGDYVIIINAGQVKLTGNKLNDKTMTMIEKYPVEMVERAVKGMLPNGPLGRDMYRKLFVYADDKHNHAAQKPTTITID